VIGPQFDYSEFGTVISLERIQAGTVISLERIQADQTIVNSPNLKLMSREEPQS